MTWQKGKLYDGHILPLCHTAAFNAWERIEKIEKKFESFTKVMQDLRENFMNFLQRLVSGTDRMIPISEARPIIIESLAFKNDLSQCRNIICCKKQGQHLWSNGSKIQLIHNFKSIIIHIQEM